ncbi:MAG: glycosyltransferase family 1 protein [Candidatus Cloacimonetes bacterium]|nr:glycosyltransferase family 1 protein [Candidatus Cloacimonadota bacterium]
MKIGIQTWGSTGDCRPMFVLAKKLKQAGCDVQMAVTCLAGHGFEKEATDLGIEWIGAPKDIELSDADFHKTFGEACSDLVLLHRLLKNGYFPFEEHMMQASEILARDSDVLIQHFMCHTLRIAAIKHNLPCVSVHFWPGSLSTRNSAPYPLPNLGTYCNQILWNRAHDLLNFLFQKQFSKMAKQMGVPMARFWPDWWTSKELTLIACSQNLWPKEPDWPESFFACGFLDDSVESGEIPEDLKQFLENGEPPVLFSFGSMGYLNASRRQEFMENIMQNTPCRFLAQLCDKDQPTGSSDGKIYRFLRLPHASLFPHCVAAIHHGGAGTTHSVLKAGLPAMVISFCEEQYSWGLQVHKMGVGPRPFRYKNIGTKDLSRQILELTRNTSYKTEAIRLSENMNMESGVNQAITKIKSLSRW